MRKLCLQFIFGVSLLFVLAFLSVPEVKATNVAFYDYLDYGAGNAGSYAGGNYGVGVSFTATYNSISEIKVNFIGSDTQGNQGTLYICEIPLIESNTGLTSDCLDTPYTQTYLFSNTLSYDVVGLRDFVLTTNYLTTPGHIYRIKFRDQTGSNASTNIKMGDTPVSGFLVYGAQVLYTAYNFSGQIYADDTLESYCGDNVCNGTETSGDCPEDCGPPPCTADTYLYSDWVPPYNYSSCSPDGIQYRLFTTTIDGCDPSVEGTTVMPQTRSCIYTATPSLNTIYDFTQFCYAGYPCHYTFNYFVDNDFTETDIVKIYQCGDPITIGDTVNVSTCDTDKTLVSTQSFDVSLLNFPQTINERTSTMPLQYLSADVIYEIQIYDPTDTTLKADLKTSLRWLPHYSMPIYSPTTTLLLTGSSVSRFGSAHTMACTSTDWADTNWWTQLRCGTMEALLFIPYTIVDGLKDMINSIGDTVVIIFPFNIPAQVLKSWNDSATTALPSNYNWLKIADSNGNVYINFPAALSGSSSSTPILVWGTDVFTPTGSTAATMFGHIKDFSILGLYLSFIYGLWAVGKRLLNEIGFINHEEKIRKRELQL